MFSVRFVLLFKSRPRNVRRSERFIRPTRRCISFIETIVSVGNIPYEATEEKLKDIFNEVGPVISFKLVLPDPPPPFVFTLDRRSFLSHNRFFFFSFFSTLFSLVQTGVRQRNRQTQRLWILRVQRPRNGTQRHAQSQRTRNRRSYFTC